MTVDKGKVLLIILIISLMQNLSCNKENGNFFLHWHNLSRLAEAKTGLAHTGFWIDSSKSNIDEVYAKVSMGIGYEGEFSIFENKILLNEIYLKKQIVLFDFSLREGDFLTQVITYPIHNNSEELITREFNLRLNWKAVDTCIMDTIFFFSHEYEYSEKDAYRSEIGYEIDDYYFIGKKSGVLGWARGRNDPSLEKEMFFRFAYGRFYFTDQELSNISTYPRKLINNLNQGNFETCLNK